MRTAFAAILAAVMLTATAAANPYYTIETTFTATPSVQVGDQAIFTLTLTLLTDPIADAAAGVTVFGSAFGGNAYIDNGDGLISGGFISGPGLPGNPPYVVNFRSAPYLTPGDFITTLTGQVEISIGCTSTSTACPQSANPYDTYAFFQATTPVSVAPVPGPVLGAGLPGLAAFCAGILAWRRVKRPSGSI